MFLAVADILRGLRRGPVVLPPPGIVSRPRPVADQVAPAVVAEPTDEPVRHQPLRPGGYPCPHCAGLRETIRQLESERAALRSRLAGHELAATRGQRLGTPEAL